MVLLKIVALMAWYRERPDWLYESIRGLLQAGVTHLVAVDGAYAHFPDAKRRSSQAEHDSIRQACLDTGIKVTLKTPPIPWASEVAKRNYLFRLGQKLTDTSDWYFVWDSDFFVHETPDLPSILADTSLDVASVQLIEPPDPTPKRMRLIFRAIRGIRVDGNHYTYRIPDGRYLLARSRIRQAPALELDFAIEHRTKIRDTSRYEDAQSYYGIRDALKLELGPCHFCDTPAVAEVRTNLKFGRYGKDGQQWTSDNVPACVEHGAIVLAQFRADLLAHGIDYRTAQAIDA